MHPTERLVNLVALLLDATRPLTFEDIRDRLPAYGQTELASSKRMFERDKDLLRDIGIPVELQPTDAWDVEEGYLISKEKYYLPEIAFTSEEISALFVAAQAAGEDASAELAVRKLLFGADGGVLIGASRALPGAMADPAGARLTAVANAVTSRRRIRFAYRTARGTPSERLMDPWGLVWRRGHWYVVGPDLERGEVRSFRLSRIQDDLLDEGVAGEPPEGFRAADHVQAGPWGPGEPATSARVAFAPEVAWWAVSSVEGAEVERSRKDGWVEATIPSGPGEELASWILSFGPDAVAIAPRSLRDEVGDRLEAVLASL